MEEFSVFRATIQLLRDRGMDNLIHDTYRACLNELKKPAEDMHNKVRDIYEPFTVDGINRKIVAMLKPDDMITPVEIVYQSIEGLHKAIPDNRGDWYFTGHYPTPGGKKMCVKAFINYYESVYGKQE